MSKINYEKIRKDNIEEYGKGTRHLSYFADIYTTRTHFIFEVLQNAEDALSRRQLTSKQGFVRFHLHHYRLEIYHNGKPFDERNIVGICGIGEGTKAGDFTQIGKFGIGFKSVYAYSFFPQIHSETEHFEIRRFVEPYEIEPQNSQDTLIVLPFDQPDTRPKWAFRDDVIANVAESEISLAITKLNIRTLLFLRQIEKIEWILPNGERGFLTKQTRLENPEHDARLVKVIDYQGKQEQWRIFTRTINVKDGQNEQQATVEVAFLLDENGKVTRATDTELVISFPTEKKTELGFLIQAPFKAIKSRDNIKSDDLANHQMLETAAKLAADSLAILRDSGCLVVASYNALPLDEDDFPENSFFRPVYEKIRDALKTQLLLPTCDGRFIKADEAKLARGKELVELFSPEQLAALFGKQQLVWLDSSITSDKFPEFHGYLLNLVDGIQVTSESLVPKLTAEFLKVQAINWLVKFIQYVEDGAKALKLTPFIRLQSGKQVALSDKPTEPAAWFAPAQTEGLDLSAFPLVHADLAANKAVIEFLLKEDIREIDAADLVIKCILPKYSEEVAFNDSDYLNDLKQIAHAYSGNDETKQKLEKQLDSIEWLACVQAGEESLSEITWKRPRENDLFARLEGLEISFSELEGGKIYFLHPLFDQHYNDNSSFKDYLTDKCVYKLDSSAIVERIILPKYKTLNIPFDESKYRKDLQWILKAPNVASLKQTRWVACIHASGNMSDEVIWKRPNASEHDKPYPNYYLNQEFEKWRKDSTIYESNQNHEAWFAGLEDIDAYFLRPCILEVMTDDFIKKQIKPIDTLVKKRIADHKGYINIASNYGQHIRGLNGFDPDFEIIALNARIDSNLEIEHCIFLWDQLKLSSGCIKGIIEKSNRQNFENQKKEEKMSIPGKLLSSSSWLPDKAGSFHKPSELLLTDLPDEFEIVSVSAREVSEKLGMKKPETQQAISVIAGDDPNKLSRLERFLSASEEEQEKMLKIIPQEIPPRPAPSFKDELSKLARPQRGDIQSNETYQPNYSLKNPERYQNKVNQEAEENIHQYETTPQTIQFSVVRDIPSNQAARVFLYQEYRGRCQITDNTFPKASANSNGEAEYYFEVCSILSYNNANYLNDAGNMLCVSADTAAKLKNASREFLEDWSQLIQSFKNRQVGESQSVKAKIRLAGEICEITWSERHFAKLVTLYSVDSLKGESA